MIHIVVKQSTEKEFIGLIMHDDKEVYRTKLVYENRKDAFDKCICMIPKIRRDIRG